MIRIVMGVAVNCSWSIRKLDVNNAFCRGHYTIKFICRNLLDSLMLIVLTMYVT